MTSAAPHHEPARWTCQACGHALYKHRESREQHLMNPRQGGTGCTEPGCPCTAAVTKVPSELQRLEAKLGETRRRIATISANRLSGHHDRGYQRKMTKLRAREGRLLTAIDEARRAQ